MSTSISQLFNSSAKLEKLQRELEKIELNQKKQTSSYFPNESTYSTQSNKSSLDILNKLNSNLKKIDQGKSIKGNYKNSQKNRLW